MPANDLIEYAADFRAQAAILSSKFLEQSFEFKHSQDITGVGASLCVPASPDPQLSRRIMRRRISVQLAIVFTGLGLGAILLALSIRASSISLFGIDRIPVWPGAILFATAWIAMTFSVDFESVLARLRLDEMGTPVATFISTEKVCIARIEDPDTYRTIKVMIDDIALLYCDASRSLILLEGVCYRYVIRAQDVSAFRKLGGRFTELRFRVAGTDEILSLAMRRNSMWEELKKQLTAGSTKPAIEPLLERTFGMKLENISFFESL